MAPVNELEYRATSFASVAGVLLLGDLGAYRDVPAMPCNIYTALFSILGHIKKSYSCIWKLWIPSYNGSNSDISSKRVLYQSSIFSWVLVLLWIISRHSRLIHEFVAFPIELELSVVPTLFDRNIEVACINDTRSTSFDGTLLIIVIEYFRRVIFYTLRIYSSDLILHSDASCFSAVPLVHLLSYPVRYRFGLLFNR